MWPPSLPAIPLPHAFCLSTPMPALGMGLPASRSLGSFCEPRRRQERPRSCRRRSRAQFSCMDQVVLALGMVLSAYQPLLSAGLGAEWAVRAWWDSEILPSSRHTLQTCYKYWVQNVKFWFPSLPPWSDGHRKETPEGAWRGYERVQLAQARSHVWTISACADSAMVGKNFHVWSHMGNIKTKRKN